MNEFAIRATTIYTIRATNRAEAILHLVNEIPVNAEIENLEVVFKIANVKTSLANKEQ